MFSDWQTENDMDWICLGRRWIDPLFDVEAHSGHDVVSVKELSSSTKE